MTSPMIFVRKSRSKFVTYTVLIVFLIPLYIYFRCYVSPNKIDICKITYPMPRGVKRYTLSSKIMLLWTGLYEDDSWTGLAEKILSPCDCLITRNRSYFPRAKLVVFHWRNINETDLPTFKPSGQLWIWMLTESPIYTFQARKLPEIGKQFDCWASYRKDSDFVLDYARFVETNQSNNPIKVSLASKTKSVAWMVSHCNAVSGRDEYVNQLSRFIDVDVYGNCGKLKCGQYYSFKHKSCYELVERDYKFYLSFENSICKDYVTEKAFNWINYNVIPIVFGGGDYAKVMPNHSFINALDFPSPQDLAIYLKELSADEERYNSYFDWKKTGMKASLRIPENYAAVFCEIVEQVRLSSDNQKTICNRIDQDLYKWWFDEAQCRSWHPTKALIPVKQFSD